MGVLLTTAAIVISVGDRRLVRAALAAGAGVRRGGRWSLLLYVFCRR